MVIQSRVLVEQADPTATTLAVYSVLYASTAGAYVESIACAHRDTERWPRMAAPRNGGPSVSEFDEGWVPAVQACAFYVQMRYANANSANPLLSAHLP